MRLNVSERTRRRNCGQCEGIAHQVAVRHRDGGGPDDDRGRCAGQLMSLGVHESWLAPCLRLAGVPTDW